MAVHDWTRVEDGIFHAFHTSWIAALQRTLNNGLLTGGYYALAEQHAGRSIADVLTLHAAPPPEWTSQSSPGPTLPLPPDTGGVALAEAPPRTRRKLTVSPSYLTQRRTLAIRHTSGHRLVSLVEIVSPGNKDRVQHVADFVDKVEAALRAGVHALLLDVIPPGTHDSAGMHGAIWERLDPSAPPYDLPDDEPLTLASYVASTPVEIFVEHVSVGAAIPDMPLFLRPDRYVNVPLDATYQTAFGDLPGYWRDVLESVD